MNRGGRVEGSGAFVARDERERLMAALAELALARDYEEIPVPDIAELAGVDAAAFQRHFESKDDCLVAGYEAVAEQAFSAAADAFVATPGSWAEAGHAALAELLRFVSVTPGFAHLAVHAFPRAGESAVACRDRVLDLFMEFLEPGYVIAGDPPDAPRTPSHMIAGSIYEIFRSHVADGRLAELPDALPGVTLIVLSPFVGREEATRIAREPVRRA